MELDQLAIRQMLADLGGNRRDILSAPAADHRGHATAIDQHAESNVLEEDKKRRQRIKAAATNNRTAAAINAWNEIEGSDSDTEELENRMNGQGHRNAMRQARGRFDERREAFERRHGHERLLYLEQRDASALDSYKAVPAGQRSDRARRLAVPRARPSLPVTSPQSILAGKLRTRALSPRAAGTIRFLRDRPVNKLDAPMRTAASNVVHKANEIPLEKHPASPVKKSNIKAAAHSRVQTPSVAQMSSASSTTIQEDREAVAVHRIVALWRAANPGSETNEWLRKNPDQAGRLRVARRMIVDDAVYHAVIPTSAEAKVYYETHPERKWMLDAAVHLREMLVRNRLSALREYVENNPDMEDISEAVEQAFSKSQIPHQIATKAEVVSRKAVPNTEPVVKKPNITRTQERHASRSRTRSKDSMKQQKENKKGRLTPPSDLSTFEIEQTKVRDEARTAETVLIRDQAHDIPTITPPLKAAVEKVAASERSPRGQFGLLNIKIVNTSSKTIVAQRRFEVCNSIRGSLELVVSPSMCDVQQALKQVELFASSMRTLRQTMVGASLGEDGLWEEV